MPPLRSQVALLDSLEFALLWADKQDGSSGKPGRLASTYVSEGHQRKCLLLCKNINCLSRIHPLINKPVKQHTRNELTNIRAHGQRGVKLGLEPMTPTLNPGPSGVYNSILWPFKILSLWRNYISPPSSLPPSFFFFCLYFSSFFSQDNLSHTLTGLRLPV